MAKSRRPWVVGGAAVLAVAGVVIGVVALGASGASDAEQVAFARQSSLEGTDYEDICPAGAPIPSVYYDLGLEFRELKRSSHRASCQPAPPANVSVVSGPTEAVGYYSVIYGDCTPTPSTSCFPPLEIQSWPQCARNPRTFAEPGPGGTSRDVTLNPSTAVRLSNDPDMPVQSFEGGARLEIYSGETTIVAFASNRGLAHQAAIALAAAAHRARPASPLELKEATRLPGDASTCTHRLIH